LKKLGIIIALKKYEQSLLSLVYSYLRGVNGDDGDFKKLPNNYN